MPEVFLDAFALFSNTTKHIKKMVQDYQVEGIATARQVFLTSAANVKAHKGGWDADKSCRHELDDAATYDEVRGLPASWQFNFIDLYYK